MPACTPLGQVASVRVPFAAPRRRRASRAQHPPAARRARARGCRRATEFHARFDATGKRYRYRIFTAPVLSPFDRSFVWHLPYPSDIDAMRRRPRCLVGRARLRVVSGPRREHARRDPDDRSRRHRSKRPDEIQFVVEGDGFLRHMVRIIVGSLVDVGAGPSSPVDWLARGPRSEEPRDAAGPTAPALGLDPRARALLMSSALRSRLTVMALAEMLAAVPAGSAEEGLAPPHRFQPAAAPHRHHHGRQRAMGGQPPPAARRGASRRHRVGARGRRELCARLGIQVLTLYAFSVENWKRPDTRSLGAHGPACATTCASS